MQFPHLPYLHLRHVLLLQNPSPERQGKLLYFLFRKLYTVSFLHIGLSETIKSGRGKRLFLTCAANDFTGSPQSFATSWEDKSICCCDSSQPKLILISESLFGCGITVITPLQRNSALLLSIVDSLKDSVLLVFCPVV